MTDGRYDYVITELDETVSMIEIIGNFGMFATIDLDEIFQKITAKNVIINLDKTTYMNSVSINSLIRYTRNKDFILVCGNRCNMKSVLELLRIDKIVPIFEEQEDAVQYLKEK